MFHICYALKEVLRRPARSAFVASIVAIALAALLVIGSIINAMLEARARALSPLAKAKIDLVITSPGSTNYVNTNGDVFINLEGRNLNPGQPFIEDTIELNALKAMDMSSIGRLAGNSDVAELAPVLLLTVSRVEGKAPDKIVIPEKSVDPLTKQERADIDSKVSSNQQYIELEKELFRLRDLILQDKATSEEKKRYQSIGQQLTDIEFSYYPERFKKFEAEEVRPAPIKAKQSKFAVAGVDIDNSTFGLLRPSDVIEGRYFLSNDTLAVILREDFAKSKGLKVGSYFSFKGIDFNVIGLAKPAAGLSSAQVYMPLSQLQQVAKIKAVNMLALRVEGAKQVDKVKKLTLKLLPGSNVLETSQASAQLTGSMGRAEELAKKYTSLIILIIALAATVMIGITVIAALSGRRRELGALRAVGWSRFRLAAQIALELIIQATAGVVAAIGLSSAVSFILRNLKIKADFAVSSFDNSVTGLGLSSSKSTIYLVPYLDGLDVFMEAIVVMVLSFFLGYVATLLYLRQYSINMLAHEGE
ncbi:MAG: ABC transporter permease [Firmicutes bacterium]|nr:ABC transporter permease [Bacillota bacterium]